MKFLVDPQLIMDALKSESEEGRRALNLFEAHKADELILAPTSYIALSPAFMGIRSMQDRFLETVGIRVSRNAPAKVLDAAYSAWSRYQQENPRVAGGNTVFDQLYIGAYALLYDGILTCQGELYRKYFESLNVIEP